MGFDLHGLGMVWELTCMVSKSQTVGAVRLPRTELATSNDHPFKVRVPLLLNYY